MELLFRLLGWHTIILISSLLPHPGVVFPYSPYLGRYNLNYNAAQQACMDQGAVVASFDQLYDAWRDGLDWCNAGWLNDGTVQYPITKPREPCGGSNKQPGVRNYGRLDKLISHYDVFCYVSPLNGGFTLYLCIKSLDFCIVFSIFYSFTIAIQFMLF